MMLISTFKVLKHPTAAYVLLFRLNRCSYFLIIYPVIVDIDDRHKNKNCQCNGQSSATAKQK
jgi:hypothetical protein